jgi:hypothetical protein
MTDASEADGSLRRAGIRSQQSVGSRGTPLNGTWTYNGNTWTRQSPSAAPPPRHNAVMAYDPTLNSLVLFGGTDDNTELADTWTYAPAHQVVGG